MRGTNLASQIISFTGLVGSGDMKSEWHFAQAVVDDKDQAAATGAEIGDNPALSFYMKSQGLSTAFLLLYAVIVLALVGYFSKIIDPDYHLGVHCLALPGNDDPARVLLARRADVLHRELIRTIQEDAHEVPSSALDRVLHHIDVEHRSHGIAISVKAMSFIPSIGSDDSTAFLKTALAMIVGSAIATWIPSRTSWGST